MVRYRLIEEPRINSKWTNVIACVPRQQREAGGALCATSLRAAAFERRAASNCGARWSCHARARQATSWTRKGHDDECGLGKQRRPRWADAPRIEVAVIERASFRADVPEGNTDRPLRKGPGTDPGNATCSCDARRHRPSCDVDGARPVTRQKAPDRQRGGRSCSAGPNVLVHNTAVPTRGVISRTWAAIADRE